MLNSCRKTSLKLAEGCVKILTRTTAQLFFLLRPVDFKLNLTHFIAHIFTVLVDNFTSVLGGLYTQITAPIINTIII